jgi:hypothetical protein
MGNPVMTAVFLVLRLGIGLILLRLALKDSRHRSLHWLAAVFYLNFVNLFLRGPAHPVISLTLTVVIQICLALFTHATFYKNRRSPVVWVIAGLLAAGGASLYLAPQRPAYTAWDPMRMMSAVNWLWHGLVAWQVWRRLRSDGSIEDWVKARYVMVVTYAAAMAALFLLPGWRTAWPVVGMAWTATFIVALLLQYLAWGMPAVLRRYLNRNYQPSAAAQQAMSMTEEDVLRALERQAR